MLSIGLLSLICALASGVFGFGADAPPDWTWEKGSFFTFLLVAAVSFVGSMLSRPSLLWEVLDEIQGQRFQHRKRTDQSGHSHQVTNFLPSGVILTDSAEQDAVAAEGDTTRSRCGAIICLRILGRI